MTATGIIKPIIPCRSPGMERPFLKKQAHSDRLCLDLSPRWGLFCLHVRQGLILKKVVNPEQDIYLF